MELKNTGIVYRNPKPHVWSRHAYFPSVVNLGGGELLCSFLMSEAFESADGRIFLARSLDHGATWQLQGRMRPEEAGAYSEMCRLMRSRDGTLVANVFRWDRHREGEGLANPQTLGFVETTPMLARSRDGGRTWSDAETFHPPIVGPEFELCSPIVELSDGRWLLPTATWKAWDGHNPTGMKAVAFVSRDAGRTWPEYVNVLDGVERGIIHFESKVAEMRPGLLVSIGWAYHEADARDHPNVYSISSDGGRSFGPIRQTDLSGQTATILSLGGDRLLCVYRRTDQPGLWAADVSLKNGRWRTLRQTSLWGADSLLTAGCDNNRVRQFNVLRFGAPCMVRLDSGDIFIAFWCVEDCVSVIRWFTVRMEDMPEQP